MLQEVLSKKHEGPRGGARWSSIGAGFMESASEGLVGCAGCTEGRTGIAATRIHGPNCGCGSERLPTLECATDIGRSWRCSTGRAGKWEEIWGTDSIKKEGLALRQRLRRRRRVAVQRRERRQPTGPNQVWSLDFVADQLADGRRFRALAVVEVFTCESLAIGAGQSLKGEDVVRVLNQISAQLGVAEVLFCDNGSEFSGQAMDLWAYQHGVWIDFSRPGKPTDNAHVESFNGTFRQECLNAHWCMTLSEAKEIIEVWRPEY